MAGRHGRSVEGGQANWWAEDLWAAAASLPVIEVPLDDIPELDQDCWFENRPATIRAVAGHARRIMDADLSLPVILSADGRLMDGGHRIARAMLEGRAHVLAQRFEVDPEPAWITPDGCTYRRSAKVLLVDEDRCVLLLSGIDRTKPDLPAWWFPVGGRVESGESDEEAAIREVAEETGLVVHDVGPVVLRRRFEWDFEGNRYDQHEVVFVVRVPRFEPAVDGHTETEKATFRGHRWWSVDELRATTEVFFPEDLPDVIGSFTE